MNISKTETCLYYDKLCFYIEEEIQEGKVFLYDYFSRNAVAIVDINDLVKCDLNDYTKMVLKRLKIY